MSKDDYPEHLNPFAEEKPKRSTLKLSSSFRDFTKTLRKSFRIKKKQKSKSAPLPESEQVQIRPKVYNVNTLPAQTRITLPVALPRSRFQERVSKIYVNGQPNNRTLPKSIDVTSSYNPFEETEEEIKTIRRRAKKRAPLPPKSISSQNINSEFSLHNQSNWSLTSVETDYTIESIDNLSTTDALAETFASMNKEIEKLCDDTNNNNIVSQNEQKIIPDIVVSCSSDEKPCENKETDNCIVIVKDITQNLQDSKEAANENIENKEIIESSEDVDDQSNENLKVINENKIIDKSNIQEEITTDAKEKTKSNIPHQASFNGTDSSSNTDCINANAVITDNKDSTQEKVDLVEDCVQVKDQLIEEQIDNKDCNNIDKESTSDHDSVEINDEIEPSPKPIQINEDITNAFTPKDDIPDMDEYLEYNERLSLYIAGSTDELNNYNEKILYITGSNDNLNESNNNPIPKQRKNKLSKDLLLGNHN